MGSFFFWTFFVFLTLYIVFRVFGRQIIQFLLRQVFKQVAKDAENQARQYQRNYGGDPFKESIFVNDNVKVTAPKSKQKKSVSADEIAEDIEFEDVPEN